MALYYSLDRRGLYRSGQNFNLTQLPTPALPMTPQAEAQFSSGISMHGLTYFIGAGIHFSNRNNNASAAIEYALELFRRLHFPDKPSRFVSMFGCETIDEVKHFRGTSKSPLSTPIYEVHSDSNCHKGDMNLFNPGCPLCEFDRRMYAYWRGETYSLHEGYEPFWEMIIPLPATIGQQAA
ncbi:hypothetical protein FRN05_22300 [Salmonella enterica subsp. enterica]|nr:hypothetical protein [Salmonella enterica]ECK7392366.1 hypothetical protein [Salmonella enterica subsp. enterica serovar Meleagridis]EHA9179271.1 hypothetical protein [Salmonella enterica subsp. enterica serovar Adabraka]EHS4854295.1 hypothetical protein [Salmonella enterica]EJO8368661.1 hypothetical protein [Salmonella enterica]